MHHRQWWPAAEHLTCKTAASALVNNVEKCEAAAGNMSARSGGLAQAGFQGMLAAEASEASCGLSPSSRSPLSKQSESTSLDWQTALLRKLLPNSNFMPSAPASHNIQSSQPAQHDLLDSNARSLVKGSNESNTASTGPFLYAGVFLDPLSSARLLAWCPPKHSQLSADHLTLLYRPSAEQVGSLPTLGASVELQVIYKAQDSTIQAVAVRGPQWVSQLLHCPAHVTVSMADGVKAKTSANLLRRVQQGLMVGVQAEQCHDTITLTGRVGIKLEDGSIAFSASELADKTAASAASAPNATAGAGAAAAAAVTSIAETQSFAVDRPSIQPCHDRTGQVSQPQTAAGLVTSIQEQSIARQSLSKSVESPSVGSSRPKASPATAKVNTSVAKTAHATGPSGRQQVSDRCDQFSVPYVQYEELSDEDALEALQQLDALLAPSRCTRFTTGPSSARQTGLSTSTGGTDPSPVRQTGMTGTRDSVRRQVSGSKPPPSAHTSTVGKGARKFLHGGSQPQAVSDSIATQTDAVLPKSAPQRLWSASKDSQRGSRTVTQTDAAAPKSSAQHLWSASGDIQRASSLSSSSPIPLPMRILKRPSIPSSPCPSSPNFAVSPPLAAQIDTKQAAQSDNQAAACTARQTDKQALTDAMNAAAIAVSGQQSLDTVSSGPVNLKASALSTPAEMSSSALTPTASLPVSIAPGSSSTALSNERLRSQSVFKYLQRQQHSQKKDESGQGRTSEVPTEPATTSAPRDASALNSSTVQSSLYAAANAFVASSPEADISTGPASDLGSGRLPPQRSMSPVSNSGLSGSSEAELGASPAGRPASAASPQYCCNSPVAGSGSTASPQERSSSSVDELVLEMQVQHLMDKVPGLQPAMATFTLKACQGNVEQAIMLLQQHLPALAEPSPAAAASVTVTPSPSATVAGAPACSPPDSSDSLHPSPIDVERDVSSGQRPLSRQQLQRHQSPDSSTEHSNASSSKHSPAELTIGPEQSSSVSSKQVLLPAGATHAKLGSSPALNTSSRHSNRKHLTVSPAAAPVTRLQAGADIINPSSGSSDSETDFYDSTGASRRQPELAYDGFLLANDPVAAAVDEAGRLVAERSKMKSVADQERQALGLHRQARNTYFAAAQMAYEKGNREAAQELAGKGKEHAQLAKEARHRANQAAYDSCNLSVTNRFKVDLHGLHVEEALQVLEQHLLSLGGLGCPGGVLLQVVTGVGKHSWNGRPKILPAVVRYLSDAGCRFSEAVGNSGVLDVFIGGQRRLL